MRHFRHDFYFVLYQFVQILWDQVLTLEEPPRANYLNVTLDYIWKYSSFKKAWHNFMNTKCSKVTVTLHFLSE